MRLKNVESMVWANVAGDAPLNDPYQGIADHANVWLKTEEAYDYAARKYAQAGDFVFHVKGYVVRTEVKGGVKTASRWVPQEAAEWYMSDPSKNKWFMSDKYEGIVFKMSSFERGKDDDENRLCKGKVVKWTTASMHPSKLLRITRGIANRRVVKKVVMTAVYNVSAFRRMKYIYDGVLAHTKDEFISVLVSPIIYQATEVGLKIELPYLLQAIKGFEALVKHTKAPLG
jgi:hypothetical protein